MLQSEQRRSEQLLRNRLPQHILEKLKKKQEDSEKVRLLNELHLQYDVHIRRNTVIDKVF